MSKVRQERGFVLVLTISIVVVLTVMMVGMLTVSRMELGTARTYSDSYRAELAVESGMEAAKGLLATATASDDFVLLLGRDGDAETPYLFAAQNEGGGESWTYVPLYSGADELAGTNLLEGPEASFKAEDFMEDWEVDDLEFEIPKIGWVGIMAENRRTGVDEEVSRYAFWIEDLTGKVDLDVAGGAMREDGLEAMELQLASLFEPDKGRDEELGAAKGQVDDLDERRGEILSMGMVNQVLGEEAPLRLRQNAVVGIQNDREQQVIPRGMGFAPEWEGRAKAGDEGTKALNEYVLSSEVGWPEAAAEVELLAQHIDGAYPQFKNRKGGMSSEHDYVKTIAASIIDYADLDSLPTVEPVDLGKLPAIPGESVPRPKGANWPSYRGMDSYPVVMQVYEEYWFKDETRSEAEFEVNPWFQFWNMSDQEITGKMRVRYWYDNTITFNGPNEIKKFYGYPEIFEVKNLIMQPNEILVVNMGLYSTSRSGAARTWGIKKGAFRIKSARVPANYAPANGWVVEWAEAGSDEYRLIDGTSPSVTGARRNSSPDISRTEPGLPERSWKGGNTLQFSGTGEVGDPRGTIYGLKTLMSGSTWTQTLWWGTPRNFGFSNPNRWPDQGHDFTSLKGTPTGSFQVRPDGLKKPSPDPNIAVMTISNGQKRVDEEDDRPEERYHSAAELGHIFDPGVWKNLNTPSPVAGRGSGGRTLRVGYSEFIGYREGNAVDAPASKLLDLFVADAEDAMRDTKGLINLNTASKEVLQVLGSGLRLDEDPKLFAEGDLRAPYHTERGDLFAEAVIYSRPLRSRSELGEIRTLDDQPYFGNLAQWPERSRPSSLDDESREENFGDLYDLATTRGRNFRVWVIGQVVLPNGKIKAERRKVFQIFAKPTRDASDGNRISGEVRPVVTFEGSL
jgi:hypothetical protein